MDAFTVETLVKWNLTELIDIFKKNKIDGDGLLSLEEDDMKELIPEVGLRAKFRKKLRLLKKNQKHSETSSPREDCPSTSSAGKRKVPEEPKEGEPAAKRETSEDHFSEKQMLSDVDKSMSSVKAKLSEQNKVNEFLKKKISDLKMDKREMVGVFGKTGAGKSSLINAVIGRSNLLPNSGDFKACTSVMIKVEANTQNSKFEAEIEFIEEEEWKDELWSMLKLLEEDTDPENNASDTEDDDGKEDAKDFEKKLSALYGKKMDTKDVSKLMDPKNFKEIPEFLQNTTKKLSFDSAEKLSKEISRYTRNCQEWGDDKERKMFWPLVKCVTVRVPDCELLQHITLVDLPGNGDRNKSRDTMWKEIVGKCSTVWIVAEITRAADETESWEILKNAYSLLGNGGECQHIHFICTKTDQYEDFKPHTAKELEELKEKRNNNAKKEVREEFDKLNNVKKQFNADYFQVFTVSSKDFLSGKKMQKTEIPKLQDFLKKLNDEHSETLNYVSGAYGILSLIQGASARDLADKNGEVYKEINETLMHQINVVKEATQEHYSVFKKLLSEGVEESKNQCEKDLKALIHPRRSGSGFHRTLKVLVQNNGVHKPKKRKAININRTLSLLLTSSIDEEFRKTFPNERNCAPFKGAIQRFSIDTEGLKDKYKHVELHLTFLKTEEEKTKLNLNKLIRERKKTIYSSLMSTIEKIMEECYKRAAEFTKQGTLMKMRTTLEDHVRGQKETMFEKAKDEMLKQFLSLQEEIINTIKNTMTESIDLSLNTQEYSIPDVSTELEKVEGFYNELKSRPEEGQ